MSPNNFSSSPRHTQPFASDHLPGRNGRYRFPLLPGSQTSAAHHLATALSYPARRVKLHRKYRVQGLFMPLVRSSALPVKRSTTRRLSSNPRSGTLLPPLSFPLPQLYHPFTSLSPLYEMCWRGGYISWCRRSGSVPVQILTVLVDRPRGLVFDVHT